MKRTHPIGATILISILICTSNAAIAQNLTSWTYLYDAAHTGVAADPIDLPLSMSWRYATGWSDKAVSTPAVGPDRIYFARGTRLYAVDRDSGEEVWFTELNTQICSALVLEGGTLYFGAPDGKLWAVNAASGSATWKYTAEKAIMSAPLIHNGMIYFGSSDGRLYGFNLSTDQLLQPFEASGPIQSTPAVWQDYVFVSSQDGYVYALRRTSSGFRMVWRAQLTAAYMKLFSSPVVHRGQVLVSASNRLTALDAQRGTRRWSFEAGDLISGSPAVRDRRAYIGSADGVVYCLNTTNGQPLWRFPKQGSRGPIRSSPVLAGDVLLVRSGGTQINLAARQTATGRQPGMERELALGTASYAQQQTQTGPALIMALDPESGQLLWEYRLQQPLQSATATGRQFRGAGGAPGPGRLGTGFGTSSPTMHDTYASYVDASLTCAQGSVYVVGDDGALYGFDAGATDNETPVFNQTSITFPGPMAGTEYSLVIPNESEELFFPQPAAEDLLQLPGAPPLRVATKVSDAGSGIDPDGVQILMDGQPVPTSQILFDAVQGMIWWIYNPGQPQARHYPAGTHTLTVRAPDWSGNQGGANVYFVIDNSLTQPKIPGMLQQPYGYGPGGFGTGYPGMPGAGIPGRMFDDDWDRY